VELEASLACSQDPATVPYSYSNDSTHNLISYSFTTHYSDIPQSMIEVLYISLPPYFPTKMMCTFNIYLMRATCPNHVNSLV
jgi:hypothetical protein